MRRVRIRPEDGTREHRVNILALDLSKRSTGWAAWPEGADRPVYGHWQLGSEYSRPGQTYCKLHQALLDLYKVVCPFERIFFEDPINPVQLKGNTNIETVKMLSGLAAHVESFAFAMGCREIRAVNVSTWRKEFIGTQDASRARKKARTRGSSATDLLKDLTMERCRQLGFRPQRHDEADALGILDYVCSIRDIVPPWRQGEVLRPMLTGAA